MLAGDIQVLQRSCDQSPCRFGNPGHTTDYLAMPARLLTLNGTPMARHAALEMPCRSLKCEACSTIASGARRQSTEPTARPFG